MKPSAKKRAKDDAISDAETAAPPTIKRIKLTKSAATSPAVRVKFKKTGNAPHHPPGDGYDSELEDRETDPVIEEQFILRYEGGVEEDLDYLVQMVEQNRIGLPPNSHGKEGRMPAEFAIKWLNAERRALVRIRSNFYAAVLVDFPTITESMKTWDKKNLMKTADICQMLLIFAKVANEQEAKTAPLPAPTNETDFRWPHGLTPPMHDAVQRRFRKRLTKKEVKDKEAELNRLLEADRQAADVRYELVNIGHDGKEKIGEYPEDEQDAEGDDDEEMDGGGQVNGDSHEGLFDDDGEEDGEPDADLLNELEDVLAEDIMGARPDSTQGASTLLPTNGDETNTPAAQAESGADDDGEDDDDDDDDDDEDDREDVDEDAEGEAADQDDINEAIAEAERQVKKIEGDLAVIANRLLRTRVETQLKNAKKHLADLLKRKAGDEDEEDEDEA